jgi:hypothetical protein
MNEWMNEWLTPFAVLTHTHTFTIYIYKHRSLHVIINGNDFSYWMTIEVSQRNIYMKRNIRFELIQQTHAVIRKTILSNMSTIIVEFD